jgi:hypothetical protein
MNAAVVTLLLLFNRKNKLDMRTGQRGGDPPLNTPTVRSKPTFLPPPRYGWVTYYLSTPYGGVLLRSLTDYVYYIVVIWKILDHCQGD